MLIEACGRFGVVARRDPRGNGVWVGPADAPRKIGFVGFQNSRWVTGHGIALNVCNDLAWFSHIVPCGMPGLRVTSLAQESAEPVSERAAVDALCDAFSAVFGVTLEE